MPIMEIGVLPLGIGDVSVSRYVAEAVKVLKKQKRIKYQLTSMGTIIEADSIRKLLNIAEEMHKAVLRGKIKRAITTIKIDDRTDRSLTVKGKVKSIQKKLKVLNG